MGNILGRGWQNDLGNWGLDQFIETTGLRHITGQKIRDGKYEGVLAQKYEHGLDLSAQAGAALGGAILKATPLAPLAPVRDAGMQYLDQASSGTNAAQYDDTMRGNAGKLFGEFKDYNGWQVPQQQQQVQGFQESTMIPNQLTDQQRGYTDGNSLYALGGQMPIPGAEGTGPNLYAFNGPSHEQGGMQFNQNAEIEKQETIDPKAKYVYSDQLKVPGTDKTFAEMSKKWKGKDTDDDITKKTNTLMLERLKNNQEELKKIQFEKAAQKFEKKYGGYLKEQMANGGYYTPAEAQRAHPNGKWVTVGANYGSGGPDYGGPIQYEDGGELYSTNEDGTISTYNNENYGHSPQVVPEIGGGIDWRNLAKVTGSGLNSAAKYANIGYNAYQSMQPIDYYKAVQNPQYNKAIDLASNLRYDARPELEEARRTFGQSKQAIQEFAGGSPGLALANLHGAQVQADRAKQAVLSRQQNMDNQYRLNEAQVRGNLGESYADELRKTQIYKLQAEAARRAFAGSAAASTSQAAQMNELMGSQKGQDATLAQLLQSSYGDLGPMIEALQMAQNQKKSKK
jgi:hypothetical protein